MIAGITLTTSQRNRVTCIKNPDNYSVGIGISEPIPKLKCALHSYPYGLTENRIYMVLKVPKIWTAAKHTVNGNGDRPN